MKTDRLIHKTSGSTLVEVLVTTLLLVAFVPMVLSALTSSQYLASFAKHKLQAAYVAQQNIETQRQIIATYFTPTPVTQSTTQPIVLDTKGNYNPVTCTTYSPPNNNAPFNKPPYYYLPCANMVIAVAQASYTTTGGVTTNSGTTERFTVTITWIEQGLTSKIPVTETYVEDIVNDNMLN